MATEIEMKAHCSDPAAVERLLEARARFLGGYRREDSYFHGPLVDGERVDFRLRRQADGWLCTWKNKTISRGLEVNREREFELADGPAFLELVERLGCRIFVRKNKQGKAWRLGRLTVELSNVEGLGWFVEVELLLPAEEAPRAELESAEAEIRGVLSGLGLAEADIEPRPYTAMLLESGLGAP